MSGPEDQETIRALRAGLEGLRTDPMSEEEMMDLIRNLKPEAPPRRLALVASIAAAAVLALAGGALLLSGGGKADLFAEGPQVAGAEEVEVRPPPLRVPRSETWDRERYRALLTVGGEETTIRLSYEPEDGGPRVRPSSALMPVAPRPKGAPDGTLVAVLLNANAETPWQNLQMALDGPLGVVYLAGAEPGGTLGALAAIVPTSFGDRQALQEIQRLGAAVTPQDLAAAFPPQHVIQLRITRQEDRTRYRFGRHPIVNPGEERLGLGDETRTAAELSGDGEVTLPGLQAALPKGGTGRERALVFLETGNGVRYVDVLRALESAKGCWLITATAGRRLDLSELELPEPLESKDATALTEAPGGRKRTVLNVDADGKVRALGVLVEPRALDYSESSMETWLRADRRAPFAVCRLILQRAAAAGAVPRVVFAPEDPGLRQERNVALPVRLEAEDPLRVELTIGEEDWIEWNDPQPVAGRSVVLVVPENAVAGQVLPFLLHLVRTGCVSIAFE